MTIGAACMKRNVQSALRGVLVCLTLLGGTECCIWAEDQADPPSAAAALSDLVFVRPVAAAGAVLSTAVFAVTLPYTYWDNNGVDALAPLVETPWYFVADRPLGVWQNGESPTQKANRKMDSHYPGLLGRTFADAPPERIR